MKQQAAEARALRYAEAHDSLHYVVQTEHTYIVLDDFECDLNFVKDSNIAAIAHPGGEIERFLHVDPLRG